MDSEDLSPVGTGAHIPSDEELAARKAELARMESELLAEIASRRKRTKLVIVAVIAGAVLLWVGVVIVRRILARAEVHALLDAIRERGEPLVPAYQVHRPVPGDESTAALLSKALDRFNRDEKVSRYAFRRWKRSRKPRRAGGVPLDKEGQEELLEKAMATHQDTIVAVRKAIDQARSGPLVGSVRIWGALDAPTKMAELLSACALFAATQGRQEEALADIARAIEIADMKYRGTTAWDIYTLEVLDVVILKTLAEVLATTGCKGPAVRAIIQHLDHSDFADVTVSAMEQHQANSASCAEFYLSQWLTSPKVLRGLAVDLRRLAEVTAAAHQPPWTALTQIRSMAGSGPNPAGSAFPTQAIQMMESVVRAWARRDAARVGLALELYRAEKGEYPDSLDALAPEYLSEVPPDEFTGKPLQYVMNRDGFIVYSVGPNLSDDGGVPGVPNNVLDIPWTGGDRSAGEDAPE